MYYYTETIFAVAITILDDTVCLHGSWQDPVKGLSPAHFEIGFPTFYHWLHNYNHFQNANQVITKLANETLQMGVETTIELDTDECLILFGLVFRLLYLPDESES